MPRARQRCTLPAHRRGSHTDSSYLPSVVGNPEAASVNGLSDSLRVQVGRGGHKGVPPKTATLRQKAAVNCLENPWRFYYLTGLTKIGLYEALNLVRFFLISG